MYINDTEDSELIQREHLYKTDLFIHWTVLESQWVYVKVKILNFF